MDENACGSHFDEMQQEGRWCDLCVTLVSQAVVLSRSQANEESRVGVDPKPGTESADGVEWLDNWSWKKQKHVKLKL